MIWSLVLRALLPCRLYIKCIFCGAEGGWVLYFEDLCTVLHTCMHLYCTCICIAWCLAYPDVAAYHRLWSLKTVCIGVEFLHI